MKRLMLLVLLGSLPLCGSQQTEQTDLQPSDQELEALLLKTSPEEYETLYEFSSESTVDDEMAQKRAQSQTLTEEGLEELLGQLTQQPEPPAKLSQTKAVVPPTPVAPTAAQPKAITKGRKRGLTEIRLRRGKTPTKGSPILEKSRAFVEKVKRRVSPRPGRSKPEGSPSGSPRFKKSSPREEESPRSFEEELPPGLTAKAAQQLGLPDVQTMSSKAASQLGLQEKLILSPRRSSGSSEDLETHSLIEIEQRPKQETETLARTAPILWVRPSQPPIQSREGSSIMDDEDESSVEILAEPKQDPVLMGSKSPRIVLRKESGIALAERNYQTGSKLPGQSCKGYRSYNRSRNSL